jgi:hypothetical protein
MTQVNYLKLGFGGNLSLLENINMKNSNIKLDSYILFKDNLGNLNTPNLVLSFIKENISFFNTFKKGYTGKILYSDRIVPQNIYYKAISKFFITTRGEFESFNMGKLERNALDSKFFSKTLKLNTTRTSYLNTDPTADYNRFSFPLKLNISNTGTLVGKNNTYSTPNLNNSITSSLIEKNRFLVLPSGNAFNYAVYPQSFFTYNYPKYNYPTCVVPYVTSNSSGNMEGLLMLSTGNSESKSIVYISPHGVKRKLYNTVVENIDVLPSKQQKDIESRVDGQWMDSDYGSGYWIAVGRTRYGGGTTDLIRSKNGKNWQLLTEVLPHTSQWENIAYGTGRWVALPYFHNVTLSKGATSTNNGSTWNEIDINGSNNGEYFSMTQFKKIVFNGINRWVILGRDSSDRTLTSTDGINWSGNTALPTAGGLSDYNSLAYGNGQWVAINNAGGNFYAPAVAAVSSDGINWNAVSLGAAIPVKDIQFATGRFIGIPSFGNQYLTSTNGSNWSVGTFPINVSWGGVTHDGKEWILIPGNHASPGTGITYHLSGFKSKDGLNWSGFRLVNNNTQRYWNNIISNTGTETTIMFGNDYIRRLSASSLEYSKFVSGMAVWGLDVNSLYVNSGNVFQNGFVKLSNAEKSGLNKETVEGLEYLSPYNFPIMNINYQNILNQINSSITQLYNYSGSGLLDIIYTGSGINFGSGSGAYYFEQQLDYLNSFKNSVSGLITGLTCTYFNPFDPASCIYTGNSNSIFRYDLNDLIPYTEYKVTNYLQQTTPIKDTWFYKIYSGAYTSNNGKKLFNTGTWNGIIPSGTNLYIEYISTNNIVGTNNTEFLITYTGYGSNDKTDENLRTIINNKQESKSFHSISYNSYYDAHWKNMLKFQKWKKNIYLLEDTYNKSSRQQRIINFLNMKAENTL